MSAQIRELMHDIANTQPVPRLPNDPWRQGRRARLRRRIAGSAIVLGTFAAAIAGVAILDQPYTGPEPVEPPVEDPVLPDTLYDVPLKLPDISDDPLDGPAVLMYTGPGVRDGLWGSDPVPLVVGGDGTVRAVRHLWDAGPAILSPDGTKLAAMRMGGVVVTDVETGRVEEFDIEGSEDATRSLIDSFVWTPDSRELAVGLAVSSTSETDSDLIVALDGLINVETGQWRVRTNPAPLAFSPDGRFELRREDGFLVLATIDSSLLWRVRDSSGGDFSTSAYFSPGSTEVAVSAPISAVGPDGPQGDLSIYDVATGSLIESVELDDRGGPIVWGSTGISVAVDDLQGAVMVQRIDVSEPGRPVRSDVMSRDVIIPAGGGTPDSGRIWTVQVAADYIDATTAPTGRPTAPFDLVRHVPLLAVVVFTMVALLNRQRLRAWSMRRPDR